MERITDLVSDQLTVRLWISYLAPLMENNDRSLLSYDKKLGKITSRNGSFMVRAQETLNSILTVNGGRLNGQVLKSHSWVQIPISSFFQLC